MYHNTLDASLNWGAMIKYLLRAILLFFILNTAFAFAEATSFSELAKGGKGAISTPALEKKKFPQPTGAVNDFAGVIPDDIKKRMLSLSSEILKKTGTTVVVATVKSVDGADPDKYAHELYNSWGIGKKGEDNGALIFLAVQERKIRIETGFGMSKILPDGLAGKILDQDVMPYLKTGDYGQGLLSGMLAIGFETAKDAGVTIDEGSVGKFKSGKEPDGFRGIKWGSDIEDIKKLKKLSQTPSLGNFATYEAPHDSLIFGDASAIGIEYLFWNGKFAGVRAGFLGSGGNFKKFKAILFNTFGDGQKEKAPDGSYMYTWSGAETYMMLSDFDYSSMQQAVYLMGSIKLMEESAKDLKKKQEAGKGADQGF